MPESCRLCQVPEVPTDKAIDFRHRASGDMPGIIGVVGCEDRFSSENNTKIIRFRMDTDSVFGVIVVVHSDHA